MRRLKLELGGRPRSLDDLNILQLLADKAGASLFQGRGAFIVSGCGVSGLDIAAGYLFISGELVEFPGVTVASFPAYLSLGAETLDVDQLHEDGGTKPTQRVRTITVSNVLPGAGEYITFTATGGRTFYDAIGDRVVLTSGTQTIAGIKNFSSKITSAGYSLVDEILAMKANGWVTNERLAELVVSTSKIADLAVTTDKLADLSVTAAKLATGSVTNSKIADGAVSTSKYADLSITAAKIASGTITADKMAPGVLNIYDSNGVYTTFQADYRGYTGATDRTYGPNLYSFNTNTSRYKPRVGYVIYCRRDSGGDDEVMLELQRANNSSFSGASVIARRYFRLHDEALIRCQIGIVDTGALVGNNWYRLVATNVSGVGNHFSNAYEVEIFNVKYY